MILVSVILACRSDWIWDLLNSTMLNLNLDYLKSHWTGDRKHGSLCRVWFLQSPGWLSFGRALDILQVLLCLCRRTSWRTQAEEPNPGAAEHFEFCGNPCEVTARSKSQRSCYWACRGTWVVNSSDKTSSTKDHSLAREMFKLSLWWW